MNEDTASLVEDGPQIGGRSLWVDAWRRLIRNRAAVGAAAVLALMILGALLVPAFSRWPLDEIDWDQIGTAPSAKHLFGTDGNGRDLMVRSFFGGRISLLVGLVATAVSLVIGVSYGAIAGYVGGRVDDLMMRFVDILYSLPFMFFVIMLTVVFGRHILLIFMAIGAVEWLDMARIVRGQTLSLRQREFVEAARAFGISTPAIIIRHIVPNALGPVIVYMTLTVPKVILLESFISFLGLGVQEPWTSWGVLISDGANQIESAPWMLIFPALFLAITLFSLNFVGDGLRDALDPKDR